MKLTLCIFSLFFAFNFAWANESINTKNFSCKKLNKKLAKQGFLNIQYGIFGMNQSQVFAKDSDKGICGSNKLLSKNFVRSKDQFNCRLGFECTKDYGLANQISAANDQDLPF